MTDGFTNISGLYLNTTATKAEWEATTKVIPNGLLCLETDTLGIRFGNGSDLYKDLPYVVQPSQTI